MSNCKSRARLKEIVESLAFKSYKMRETSLEASTLKKTSNIFVITSEHASELYRANEKIEGHLKQ